MRQYLYAEIETVRHLQDGQWGGPAHDDSHSFADWVALITRQAGLAVADGLPSSAAPNHRRRQLLRVAALAVAAVEALDRGTGRAVGPTTEQRGRQL